MSPAPPNNSTADDLASLIKRGQSGDEQAQAALVERYQGLVVCVIGRFFPDESAREDLVQETWYRVLKNLHAIERAEAFAAFVSSAARHIAINALKRAKRYEPLDPDKHGVAASGERVVLTHQVIERALQHLDEQHFTVLALKLYAGMTFAEIARSLGVPVGTASTRYYAAVGKLQRAVGRS